MTSGTLSIGGIGVHVGTIDIAPSTGAQAVNIATLGTGTVTLGSVTGAAGTAIKGGTGGIAITPTSGAISVVPATQSIASPTASATQNSRLESITFTGFATAGTGTQDFTITNSTVLTTSCIMVNVTNLNASGNGAIMQVLGTTQAAGSLIVHTKNVSAFALGAGDDVIINIWVMS